MSVTCWHWWQCLHGPLDAISRDQSQLQTAIQVPAALQLHFLCRWRNQRITHQYCWADLETQSNWWEQPGVSLCYVVRYLTSWSTLGAYSPLGMELKASRGKAGADVLMWCLVEKGFSNNTPIYWTLPGWSLFQPHFPCFLYPAQCTLSSESLKNGISCAWKQSKSSRKATMGRHHSLFGRSRRLCWGASWSPKRLCRVVPEPGSISSLLPAKQSRLISALINMLYSQCSLDAECSVRLSMMMTHRVTLASVSKGKQISPLIPALPILPMLMAAISQLHIRPCSNTQIDQASQHMQLTSKVHDPR